MSDTTSWLTVTEAVLLGGGIATGLLLGYFMFPTMRQARRLRIELEQARHEQERFRASVSEHFLKTADLVGEMTRSYAAVYDHLAGGARRFCDDAPAAQRLAGAGSFAAIAAAHAEEEAESSAESGSGAESEAGAERGLAAEDVPAPEDAAAEATATASTGIDVPAQAETATSADTTDAPEQPEAKADSPRS